MAKQKLASVLAVKTIITTEYGLNKNRSVSTLQTHTSTAVATDSNDVTPFGLQRVLASLTSPLVHFFPHHTWPYVEDNKPATKLTYCSKMYIVTECMLQCMLILQ